MRKNCLFGAKHLKGRNIVKSGKILLTVLMLAGLLTAGGGNSAAAVTTDAWYTNPADYEQVQQAAAAQGKSFILFFYVDWCGYCKRLKKIFLQHPEVKKSLAKYLRVKINPNKGKREQALARQYGVTGYPTFLVVRPNKSRTRIHPFKHGGKVWTVEEFISKLETAMAAKE